MSQLATLPAVAVAPRSSRAASGPARLAAEAALEDLAGAQLSPAERALLANVTSQRAGLAVIKRYLDHAPGGILSPATIAQARQLWDSAEPRFDEAVRCLLLVALEARGRNVHAIAPVDFPMLVAALEDAAR